MFRNSFLETDLFAVAENYRIIKELVKVKVIAVLKADAYGLGAAAVAAALQKKGCSDFAVTNVSEAVQLRNSGVKGNILVLGYTPYNMAEILEKYDLTQSLLSAEHAESFYGSNIKCHLALDTGMKRAGIDQSRNNAAETICEIIKKCRITGLYGHLCAADDKEHDDFTKVMIKKFGDLCRPYIGGRTVHLFNSAAALRFPTVGNAVRIGIALYGVKPGDDAELPVGVKQAVVWKSTVSSVRTVKAGESIGYGRSFTATSDIVAATVACGYADGFSRGLSSIGEVVIKGSRAKVAGRVCMDCFIVDVTDIPGVKEGDEVTLIGDGITIEDHAKSLSTIGHEVLSRIGKRVERRYI